MLNGTGTVPAASVNPATLSFTQVVGATSRARAVTLQSSGTGPLQVSGVVASPPFSQTNNCVGTIVPAASCTIQVRFTPATVGSFSGAVTITDNAGKQSVALSGYGSAPVVLSANSLHFGIVAVGSTSTAQTLTIINRLSVPLTFTSIAISEPFAIARNTCGASIAAGAICKIGVTFSPKVAGAAVGTLTFTDNAATSPQTVKLSGTGQ
jgi:hypothetical protein